MLNYRFEPLPKLALRSYWVDMIDKDTSFFSRLPMDDDSIQVHEAVQSARIVRPKTALASSRWNSTVQLSRRTQVCNPSRVTAYYSDVKLYCDSHHSLRQTERRSIGTFNAKTLANKKCTPSYQTNPLQYNGKATPKKPEKERQITPDSDRRVSIAERLWIAFFEGLLKQVSGLAFQPDMPASDGIHNVATHKQGPKQILKSICAFRYQLEYMIKRQQKNKSFFQNAQLNLPYIRFTYCFYKLEICELNIQVHKVGKVTAAPEGYEITLSVSFDIIFTDLSYKNKLSKQALQVRAYLEQVNIALSPEEYKILCNIVVNPSVFGVFKTSLLVRKLKQISGGQVQIKSLLLNIFSGDPKIEKVRIKLNDLSFSCSDQKSKNKKQVSSQQSAKLSDEIAIKTDIAQLQLSLYQECYATLQALQQDKGEILAHLKVVLLIFEGLMASSKFKIIYFELAKRILNQAVSVVEKLSTELNAEIGRNQQDTVFPCGFNFALKLPQDLSNAPKELLVTLHDLKHTFYTFDASKTSWLQKSTRAAVVPRVHDVFYKSIGRYIQQILCVLPKPLAQILPFQKFYTDRDAYKTRNQTAYRNQQASFSLKQETRASLLVEAFTISGVTARSLATLLLLSAEDIKILKSKKETNEAAVVDIEKIVIQHDDISYQLRINPSQAEVLLRKHIECLIAEVATKLFL